jgi:hypothetical protein
MMKVAIGGLFVLVLFLTCCRHLTNSNRNHHHHDHGHKGRVKHVTKNPKELPPGGSWYKVVTDENGQKQLVRIQENQNINNER